MSHPEEHQRCHSHSCSCTHGQHEHRHETQENEHSCSCGCHATHEQHHEHKDDSCSCGCHTTHEDQPDHKDHCGCSSAAKHHEHHHEGGCGCASTKEHRDHDHGGCSCGCGHDHGVEAPKGLLIRIAASAILLALSFLLPQHQYIYVLLGAAYIISGYSVLKAALHNILHGAVFDECFLMTVASLGAICIGEWHEAVMVMVLYQLGEYLQGRAVRASRRSITELMNIRPDTARVLQGQETVETAAENVDIGALIRVHPGERIPLDSIVVAGTSDLNNAALTGESIPVSISPGEQALAGCVNLSGVLTLRVEKSFSDSAASRILQMVEDASDKKARTEQFITRFARVYTPIVVGIAAALAVLPPLLGLGTWSDFIYRALDFLVISCPCALVISVPLSYFAGLGCASRNGILIKGGNFIDTLAIAETAVFDKTGTLTKGRFSVFETVPAVGISADELLTLAAHAEAASEHPLAISILEAYGKNPDHNDLSQQKELAGNGVSCLYRGKSLLAGKAEFLCSDGIAVPELPETHGTRIYVGYDGSYRGALELRDTLKEDAAAALEELKTLGVQKTVLLSGDRESAVAAMQRTLGVDTAFAELLPEDKVHHMEALQKERKAGSSLLYAGDGINDAPVLALSDVGVAMGGLGTDAAMEAADVVIMGDSLSKIPLAIRIARKTARVAKENITMALGIKIAVMVLAAFGQVGLWAAVFADVGVCLLAILNSLRASRI